MDCWPIPERKWQAGYFQVPERSRPCLHFNLGFPGSRSVLQYVSVVLILVGDILWYSKANKIKDAVEENGDDVPGLPGDPEVTTSRSTSASVILTCHVLSNTVSGV